MKKFLVLSAILAFGSNAANGDVFGNIEEALEDETFSYEEFEAVKAPEHTMFIQSNAKSGFPNREIRPYDPVGKKHYQEVILGKTHKAPFLANYDYWRYVTVYNVTTSAERVAYLPYFEEGCHDDAWAMAEWAESRNLKVSLGSSLGGDVLGLSASINMSIEMGMTFSASRRVRAVEGIAARHYPYKLSDTWEGVTYIQVYWKRSGEYGYLTKPFNRLGWTEYPFPFSLDNQNVGFKVKREVLRVCDNYNPEKDPTRDDLYYLR